MGWNWVNSIACNHEVWVLTAAHQAEDILAMRGLCSNLRFVFVPHRLWHYAPSPGWKRIENSIAKPIMNLAYIAWQRDAHAIARELVRNRRFDLVHQLTYVGFRFPGQLWKLGLPFVWGPVGGLENTAWGLLPAMGLGGAAYYAGRNLVNSAQRRWQRSPRRAASAAGPGLIAATDGIARELKSLYGADATVISEVVAPLKLSPSTPRERAPNEPLRIVWSGLLLPGKALNLLLHALAALSADLSIELHILGGGPRLAAWQELAARLGVAQRCVWHGQLPRQAALRTMSAAHVLAITSLKDLTSTVLLEGLALGLPVVCPDHCGFSGVVTPECGIKLPATSVEVLTAGFTAALAQLEADESGRRRLATAALTRAADFSADSLAAKIDAVYRRTLRQHAEASPCAA